MNEFYIRGKLYIILIEILNNPNYSYNKLLYFIFVTIVNSLKLYDNIDKILKFVRISMEMISS
jgi:hypothetical protein